VTSCRFQTFPRNFSMGTRLITSPTFLNFGKFTPSEVAHFVRSYATPEQLRSAFEMYRAFPANQGNDKSCRTVEAAGLMLGLATVAYGSDGTNANAVRHVSWTECWIYGDLNEPSPYSVSALACIVKAVSGDHSAPGSWSAGPRHYYTWRHRECYTTRPT
jgi:hypothetical protein